MIESGRGGGAYYVEISPAGLRTGGGCFHLESDQVARYRTAVAEDIHGEALAKILATLRRKGWEIKGDTLKRTPRGFDNDHPRAELLRHRSVYAAKVWEPDDVLHERACLNRVRKAWRELRPFNEWAQQHVGVSEHPRR